MPIKTYTAPQPISKALVWVMATSTGHATINGDNGIKEQMAPQINL
jgi:hypothetical protein